MRARVVISAVAGGAFVVLGATPRLACAQEELPPIGGTTAPAKISPAAPGDATAPVNAPPESTVAESELLPKPIPEAPPPSPRKKGFVTEGSIGALGFLGSFRHVAPAGPWLRILFGYEPFTWALVYAEGEAAFTDTSIASDPTHARAFPIEGFGGGLRLTAHFTPRAAIFLEGNIGAMKADIAKDALADLGYRNAEGLGAFFGGRIGVEWYQVDRHLAIGVNGGIRDATNFNDPVGSTTPLMWDAAASIRYTF